MRIRLGSFVVIGLVSGLSFMAGCGDSGPKPRPVTAPDRSGQISKLEKQVRELRKQKQRDRLARKRASAAAAVTAGSSGSSEIDAMLRGLPGEAGLVVGPPGGSGSQLSGGDLTSGAAWSTIKVPIAERVLADFGGPQGISSAQSDQISAAITLSDNDAAAALFSDLEAKHGGLQGASTAVGEMLREAGDDQTTISTQGRDAFSTYGQTEWSLAEQNRYMAALAGGCISDVASRDYLLGQMGSVGGSDTFGLGAAGFPARWKGGWGPGTDGKYLVRQIGVMDVDGREMVVSLAAIPDDGSFESGRQMASQIAHWAATKLGGEIGPPSSC